MLIRPILVAVSMVCVTLPSLAESKLRYAMAEEAVKTALSIAEGTFTFADCVGEMAMVEGQQTEVSIDNGVEQISFKTAHDFDTIYVDVHLTKNSSYRMIRAWHGSDFYLFYRFKDSSNDILAVRKNDDTIECRIW